MVTTQVPLSDQQSERLEALARSTGKTHEELIRDGVDLIIAKLSGEDWKTAIRSGAGIWRDREDLPDLVELRGEADRF